MDTLKQWNSPSAQDSLVHDPESVFSAGMRHHHIANTAYPLAYTKTIRDYRVKDEAAVKELLVKSWEGVDEMGLYVHIPFCEKRCAFCEYAVVDPETIATSEDRYFDLLEKEFELYAELLSTKKKKLVGFDIGGGTPSVAKNENVARVVALARKHFQLSSDVVISIETTPKIAANEPEKMKAYYDMGIRRVSMGVQTVHPRVLELVGRLWTSVDWNIAAAKNIRAAGFTRFNVDLMYGMFGQNLENIQATLTHVFSLDPEFVTLYRTRYKGTKVVSHSENVTLEEANTQGEFLKEKLFEAGYEGRDGKNTFSKIPGDLWTSDYLTKRVIEGMPYLGIGLGAQSFNLKYLAYNLGAAEKKMDRYEKALQGGALPIQDIYDLPISGAVGKFVAVSFYFWGVDYASFEKNFGTGFEEYFARETEFALSRGYMERTNGGLYLTKLGVNFYNGVISLFYAPGVQKYLLEKEDDAISGVD